MSLREYYAESLGYEIRWVTLNSIEFLLHFNLENFIEIFFFSDLDAPAVIPNFDFDAGSPQGRFPIELFVIMPDQRVPLEKMSPRLQQDLLAVWFHLTLDN